MRNEGIIRPATAADFTAIAALFNNCLNDEEPFSSGLVASASYVAERARELEFFVLETHEAIVGCVSVIQRLGGIGHLCVRRGSRSQGFGRRLMSAAETSARLRGWRSATLAVAHGKETLFRYYGGQGYVFSRRVPVEGVQKPSRPGQWLSLMQKRL